MDKSYWPPGSLPKEEFSWKNFLRSKGAKGLESIFKYVPESMKVSLLKGMHKMHPTQAEEFMRNMFWDDTTSAGWDEWVQDTTRHLWRQDEGMNKTYGLWQGPLKPKDYNVIYDYWPARAANLEMEKLFRDKLRDPNLDATEKKMLEDMLKYGGTDDAKYQMAVMEQQHKLNQGSMLDDAKKYQIALYEQQGKYAPLGKVIDFETKKRQMTPKGIPWSNVGMRILNHPVTQTLGKGARFIGGVGDVALGGMAISDVLGGTNMVGSSVRDVNRMMNVPMDRQGNVIQNNRVYNNLQNVAQRDVGNPNEMRGATSFDTTRYNPREMNTGGLVSLML